MALLQQLQQQQQQQDNNIHNKDNGNKMEDPNETDEKENDALTIGMADTELVANDPSERNWKGIVVALLVIVFICSLIGLAIVLTSPKTDENVTKTQLNLSDYHAWKAFTMTFAYIWSEDKLYFTNRDGSILRIGDPLNPSKEEIIFPKKDNNDIFPKEFSISSDQLTLMIPFDKRKEYRSSYIAKYKLRKIADLASNIELSSTPGRGVNGDLIQLAVWGPLASQLLFVKDNQIFYTENPFTTNANSSTDITDGLPRGENLLYGKSDWLYEEEVLDSPVAAWWNPNGSLIAFLSFNETGVTSFHMKMYGYPNSLYGSTTTLKYPKAGEDRENNNPIVQLFIYSIQVEKRKLFELDGVPTNNYVTFVKWYDNESVLVGSVDRSQVIQYLSLCQWGQQKCYLIYEEKMTIGWAEWFKQKLNEPIMDPVNRRIYLTLDRQQTSTGDFFRNVAQLSLPQTILPTTKADRTWLFEVDFDITDVYYVDTNSHILFQAAYPNITEMHIHNFNLQTKNMTHLTTQDPACLVTQLSLSKSKQHGILECKGPDPPHYKLISFTSNNSFVVRKVFDNNEEFRKKFSKTLISEKRFITVQLNDSKPAPLMLHAMMMIPPNFKPDRRHTYASILHVYGGPRRQRVTKTFVYDWFLYLSSVENIIVIQVDARGTPNRGRKFLSAVHRNLGKFEVEDQYLAYKEILQKFTYFNESKSAVFGASYGGFVVSKMLGIPDKFPRCGISLAPVTDFRLYDTAYTERYMGLLRDNRAGYEITNVSLNVTNFRGKGFFLAHGTGDDNVHISNSMFLTRALIEEDIPFHMMVFPDDNHSFSTGNSYKFLFKTIIQFLARCYNSSQPFEWSIK